MRKSASPILLNISMASAGLLAISLLPVAAQAASAATGGPHICINTQQIDNTTIKDRGAAIVFKMRDGTQWRNDLEGKCPDLVFDGYVWTVRNPDNTVCEFEQTLRVIHSGEICTLGKFSKLTPAASQSKG